MASAVNNRLHDHTRIVASPEQTSAGMPGETVILHPRSGRYFGLDEVGTHVWQLLEKPRTLAELRRSVLEEYDVTPEDCDADVRALIGQLHEAGLVELDDDAQD